MSQSLAEALESIKALGSPEEMELLAQRGAAPPRRPKVNTHIHLPPNFSAFETTSQAVRLARQQGIGVLGVANYYDYRIYADFAAEASRAGIFPLFGMECIALIDDLVRGGVLINDPGNPGRMYICGKGITRLAPMSDEAKRLIGIIRHNDSARMAEMTARVSQIFAAHGVDTNLNADAVIDMVVSRHNCPRDMVCLQERQVAQAFQESLFRHVPAAGRIEKLSEIIGAESQAADAGDTVTIQKEIRAHLMKAGKRAFVAETFVNFDQAFRLILELGGIPCYPTLADGASPICEFEDPIEKLIESMRRHNIHCMELIPIRNEPEVLVRYVRAMRAAHLAVTAGTEHNVLDMLAIEPACIGKKPVPEEIKEIFWEGACVVAAHQFLTLHGRCGFVDGDGRPNAAYDSAEGRIEAFRSLGAAVIQRYYEKNT